MKKHLLVAFAVSCIAVAGFAAPFSALAFYYPVNNTNMVYQNSYFPQQNFLYRQPMMMQYRQPMYFYPRQTFYRQPMYNYRPVYYPQQFNTNSYSYMPNRNMMYGW
jgi:hypothetical protein